MLSPLLVCPTLSPVPPPRNTLLCLQERLPPAPLSGMYNKSGGKVRLTFKLEQDQLWIGTKGMAAHSPRPTASGPSHPRSWVRVLVPFRDLTLLRLPLASVLLLDAPSVWILVPPPSQAGLRAKQSISRPCGCAARKGAPQVKLFLVHRPVNVGKFPLT